MKVSLVVASGVHTGKVIPIALPKFLIGRDPDCQLRPASQAISKKHCAILIRGTQVFLQDFGSTNGTIINDQPIEPNTEQEVNPGDRLKLGPLDFRIEFSRMPSDSTPLPDTLKSIDGVKPASGTSANKIPAPTKPQAIPGPRPTEDADMAAAMLLGMGDEDEPSVPGGSTVMEIPSVMAGGEGEGNKSEEQGKEKRNAVPSREDTSNAASEILRRYMRRPR